MASQSSADYSTAATLISQLTLSSSCSSAGPSKNEARHLPSFPPEIVNLIASHVVLSEGSQPTLAAMCGVCRTWYDAAALHLYARPLLERFNFWRFVHSVSAPAALLPRHRPRPAELVRVLDARYVRNIPQRLSWCNKGAGSVNQRVLGVVGSGLEKYAAVREDISQSSFSAFAGCDKLTLLDLGGLRGSLRLQTLHPHVTSLPALATLRVGACHFEEPALPTDPPFLPSLRSVQFSGALTWTALSPLSQLCAAVSTVTIGHSDLDPGVSAPALLSALGPDLPHLVLGPNLIDAPGEELPRALLSVLFSHPSLRHLHLRQDMPFLQHALADGYSHQLGGDGGSEVRELTLEDTMEDTPPDDPIEATVVGQRSLRLERKLVAQAQILALAVERGALRKLQMVTFLTRAKLRHWEAPELREVLRELDWELRARAEGREGDVGVRLLDGGELDGATWW